MPPIGVGPIAPGWPGRAAKLQGNAAGWDYRTGFTQPLPQELDPAFFNAAPPDQQTFELRGDERMTLKNLHPDHPLLVTSLPGIEPQATVERAGTAPQALPLRCDTLSIDTNRGVCNLVWRGQLVLAHPDEAGRVVITAAVLPFAAAKAAGQEEAATSTVPGVRAGLVKPALPFREVSPWEGTSAIARATEGAGRRTEETGDRDEPLAAGKEWGGVLPFVGAEKGRGSDRGGASSGSDARPRERHASARAQPRQRRLHRRR